MIALLIIFGVLALIMLTPVGVRVLYEQDGLFLWVKAGPLCIKLYPIQRKKKEKKKKTPKKPKAKQEPAPQEKAKTGGGIGRLKSLLPLAKKAIGQFFRFIRVNRLTVYYCAASEDAAKAAIEYGVGWSVVGAVSGIFEKCKQVKSSDLQVFIDFGSDAKPRIYADVIAVFPIWTLIYIALSFVTGYIKITNNKQKAVKEDGTSNQ